MSKISFKPWRLLAQYVSVGTFFRLPFRTRRLVGSARHWILRPQKEKRIVEFPPGWQNHAVLRALALQHRLVTPKRDYGEMSTACGPTQSTNR